MCAFHSLTDYSLLLGIHYMQHFVASQRVSTDQKEQMLAGGSGSGGAVVPRTPGLTYFQGEEGGLRAQVIEGPGIYFFGLIDILQEWNTNKKCERFLKTYLRCKPAKGISVCHGI